MIDDKTKQKFIQELEKNGNVFWACARVGIERSTFYRWHSSDKEFTKLADSAIRHGRENNCDIGEQALMLKVKDKDLGAIKYLLSRNSQRYKEKQTSNVVILHKKEEQPIMPQKSLKELLDEDEEWYKAKAESIFKRYESMGGIPPKADGTKIELCELVSYEKYIEEWYKNEEINKNIQKDNGD